MRRRASAWWRPSPGRESPRLNRWPRPTKRRRVSTSKSGTCLRTHTTRSFAPSCRGAQAPTSSARHRVRCSPPLSVRSWRLACWRLSPTLPSRKAFFRARNISTPMTARCTPRRRALSPPGWSSTTRRCGPPESRRSPRRSKGCWTVAGRRPGTPHLSGWRVRILPAPPCWSRNWPRTTSMPRIVTGTRNGPRAT